MSSSGNDVPRMLRKEVKMQEMQVFCAERQDSVAQINKLVWQYCL